MCLLLETIKIENGKIRNLEYHNRRFNSSRKALFGTGDKTDLGSLITVPADLGAGVFRCRVLYREEIEKIEFIPHVNREVRSLKLVSADDIDYSLKYADRKILELLFEQRAECDEILIVREGFITDTSISNIVFRRTDGAWITPDTPLLNGTMRMFLLESGAISEAPVRSGDLNNYTGAKMINCMLDLESSPLIRIEAIL
jgi:4-amino-4-deoxychorismate lyase